LIRLHMIADFCTWIVSYSIIILHCTPNKEASNKGEDAEY
jgi:hypothetical protein